jgi:hypothetical protein
MALLAKRKTRLADKSSLHADRKRFLVTNGRLSQDKETLSADIGRLLASSKRKRGDRTTTPANTKPLSRDAT